MNRLAKSFVLCVFCLLFAVWGGAAFAGTAYYLDSAAGSDGNPGTKEKPWKSLGKLEGLKLEAGDRVKFKRGSAFSGTVTVEASGSRPDARHARRPGHAPGGRPGRRRAAGRGT